jgi:uncharacterized membrane protein
VNYRVSSRTPAGVFLLVGLSTIGLTNVAMAQTGSLDPAPADAVVRPAALAVTTKYPSISVSPGEEADFPLSVVGPVDERVDLSIDGLPDGFSASLRGGDAIVSSVYTDAQEPPPLELRVRVPDDAQPGHDELTVSATADSGQASLPVDVVVSEVQDGSVSLESKYPVLSGDSGTSYSFDLELANDTTKDITFGLVGDGPDGWTIAVSPSGQDKASTALVTAGGHTNIKVTADPPIYTPAGRYLVGVTADGGSGDIAQAQLGVEITGSHDLALDTSDGRLNDSVATGSSDDMALVVTNTGTAPLSDIKLTASTPKGWQVTFDPETIPDLQPAAAAQVSANIAPAGNAVAGDYALTVTASSPDASSDIQLRTTVETSMIWGIVAVGIVVLAALGLMLVFRRYGRR